ncbi:dehydrogenase/reductase SDR family member 13-like [Cyprinodon tularosa]|uniref:dehydrogenase/reductase SDR family member 13-like n=1 Tax=Cyprinodon tularosa TaxID=77115 RepID=UPI0018E27EB6|nr:dehydrogenase/reductase SDR family member 13-like [Cyprinodon tularosa]
MITLLLGGLFAAIYLLLRKTVLKLPRCKSDAKLHGKTAIITGASGGIGKATALELARRGARVVLACRDRERADAAVRDIIQETGNQQVLFMQLDLASLLSVRTFAENFLRSESRLDLLINNAGVLRDGQTDDGFGLMFGANHLGHFLLTLLLLERLKASGPSRVVTVASSSYGRGQLDFSVMVDLRDSAEGCGFRQTYRKYCDSKLCNILFTWELSRRLQGSQVTCYCLHPGLIRTDLGRYLGFWMKVLVAPIVLLFFMDPESGAQTTLHCALEQGIEPLSGHFFRCCRPRTDMESKARDPAAARKLWELSQNFCGLW